MHSAILRAEKKATKLRIGSEEFLNPVRIGVVDSSAESMETLCELLHAFRSVKVVGTGSDGFKALEIVATTHPDLLIVDVDMPELDGIEVASVISYCHSSTKVLLMSADSGPAMRERCHRSRAHGFVSKQDLESTLRRFSS